MFPSATSGFHNALSLCFPANNESFLHQTSLLLLHPLLFHFGEIKNILNSCLFFVLSHIQWYLEATPSSVLRGHSCWCLGNHEVLGIKPQISCLWSMISSLLCYLRIWGGGGTGKVSSFKFSGHLVPLHIEWKKKICSPNPDPTSILTPIAPAEVYPKDRWYILRRMFL